MAREFTQLDTQSHPHHGGEAVSKPTDAKRIQREMEEILRQQADPNRPSPMAEFWAYLDERRALQSQGGRE
jgi:hypothetical protein